MKKKSGVNLTLVLNNSLESIALKKAAEEREREVPFNIRYSTDRHGVPAIETTLGTIRGYDNIRGYLDLGLPPRASLH